MKGARMSTPRPRRHVTEVSNDRLVTNWLGFIASQASKVDRGRMSHSSQHISSSRTLTSKYQAVSPAGVSRAAR